MDDTKILISREIPRLRRYALSLLRDSDAADDLVQDCIERAIRKRHLWARRGSVRSWLYRILYTQFLNGLPARRRLQRHVDIDGLASPPAVGARQEGEMVCRDIVEAMSRLPEDQRAAILLTAVEGLSYEEAADALGLPVGTVRSRIARGRERLRLLFVEPTGRSTLRRVK